MGKAVVSDLQVLLQSMVEHGASDLHLGVGAPPALRIAGRIVRLQSDVLTAEHLESILEQLMSEEQIATFTANKEIDFSYEWTDVSRFRANFFRQQGHIKGVIRRIGLRIPSLEELGFPECIEQLLEVPHGLILVTGPTGSGKSTTVAALIDVINATRCGHVITIEDPIEYCHTDKKCIVSQREVGVDTRSFHEALRYTLRQDPDVVMIGEIRDLETMEAAMKISETGHLVLATLHTNNAVQTVNRVVDLYPPQQQHVARTQLSFVLEGILSQRLIPKSDSKDRCLALEILVPNVAIRNMIRDNKTHMIYSQMQVGQGDHIMITMNQSLMDLVQQGLISMEDALRQSSDPDELKKMGG